MAAALNDLVRNMMRAAWRGGQEIVVEDQGSRRR